MGAAEKHHRAAVAALNAKRFDEAAMALDAASEECPDPDLRARIELGRAYLAYETGHPDEAFAALARALEVPGTEAETVGMVHCQRATLMLRSGRPREALAAFGLGIGHLSDPGELGKAHINRGGVHLAQGSAAAAGDDFERAVELLRQADLGTEAAMAEHNLGYARLLAGDLVSALASMDQAREVLGSVSPLVAATCDQDRAEVLMAAGMVTEGRQALRRAADTFGLARLHQRRGEAELALARTLQHSDPAAALQAARSARRRMRLAGVEGWRVRAEGVALAAEVELGHRGPALVARGDKLIEELRGQGLRWGADSVRLYTARVLTRRGDLAAAQERIDRVRIARGAPLALRLLWRDVRSELALAQGRSGAALSQVRHGLADLHAWQSSFGSLDLQTMVVGHGVSLARRGLEIAVATGRADTVFTWSESARMLASRIQPVRAPADDQVAADLAELRRLTAGDDQVSVPEPRRARELRDRVRERAWQVRGSGEVSHPAALGDVQAALGEHRALVAWVVAGGRVSALVVTRESRVLRDLGPEGPLRDLLGGLLPDLDVAGAELPPALAGAVRNQLAVRLQTLADLLVTPLSDLIGDDSLVLTPSGVLAGVPWTLLPGLAGRPVTVARSATSWLQNRSCSRLDPAGLVSGFVAGPRVPRAESEVDEAAGSWAHVEVLRGRGATAAAVADLAQRVDVLHLAAHGRHSADNPLFSGLELEGGPWYGYDIDQLPKVPSVVLLSACEVGRSSVRYGEELIGMTSAWLHAGARWVIASPAAVNDQVAHDVLAKVHRGLAAGLEPPEALAAAVPAVSSDRAPVPFGCFSR